MSSDTTKTKAKNVVERSPYPQRKRRKEDFMKQRIYSPASYSKPEWVPPEGKGINLSTIPAIESHLKNVSRNSDFLHSLHLILYNRSPKTKDVKKNIGLFSGFARDFDKEEQKKYIAEKLLHKGRSFLANLYEFLNLKAIKGHTKDSDAEELADAIFAFLKKPSKELVKKKYSDFEIEKKKPKTPTKKKSSSSSSKKKKASSDSDSESEEEEKKTSRKRKSKSDDEGESKSKSKKSKSSKSDDESEKKSSKRKRASDDEGDSKSSKRRKSSSKSEDEKSKDKDSDSEGEEKSKKKGDKKKSVSIVSDLKEELEPGQFTVIYAANNRTSCNDKDCKKRIDKDEVIIGRATGKKDSVNVKFFHPECFFQSQKRFRGEKVQKVESKSDLIGFDKLEPAHQKLVEKYLNRANKEKKEESKDD